MPGLLRTCVVLLLATLFLTGQPARADENAIRSVIAGQIEAFRRDDGPAAWAYASPGIQALYPAPSVFLDMVRQGYAPCYRPRQVGFLDLVRDDTGAPVQTVELIGPDGLLYLAHYQMEQQPDGSWKISAVWLERLQGGVS